MSDCLIGLAVVQFVSSLVPTLIRVQFLKLVCRFFLVFPLTVGSFFDPTLVCFSLVLDLILLHHFFFFTVYTLVGVGFTAFCMVKCKWQAVTNFSFI